MGLGDMNMGGFDPNQARDNFNNRTQAPPFAPGMQPDSNPFASNSGVGGTPNPFASSPSPMGSPSPLGGAAPNPFANPIQTNPMGGIGALGQPPMGSPFSTQPMNPMGMQQQAPKSTEDKVFEVLGTSFKSFLFMFKDIFDGMKGLTPVYWQTYGFKLSIIGGILLVLGIVTKIIGFKDGLLLSIGGASVGIVGIPLWLLNTGKATGQGMYAEEEPLASQPIQEDPFSQVNNFTQDTNDNIDWNDASSDEGDWEEGEEEEDDWAEDFDANDITVGAASGMDADSALNSMQEVPMGMYTKQFLYENFIKVLPTYSPQFAKFKEYDSESDSFLFWNDLVEQASELQGFDEENYPYLMELSENAFIIKATVSRNSKLKPNLMADELATAYAHDAYPDDQEKRAGVFATYETVMNKCIFTIFTGSSPFIALKDIYNSCEDYVLSRDVQMPIVLGTNELGIPIKMDFKSVESLITAGMPRSGKSWFVQNLLTQLCALNSPSDVNLYFLDPKAATSDYYKFKLPHVKCFASQYRDTVGNVFNKEFPSILATLRSIVNKEAPRRKKLLGDAGCVNIGDFRKKYPDVNLPYLYIVIDEMVTLSQMLKEDESEYQSYLDQIVTQFPNLGIRGIFIPHEVKNQIMSKTASDSVKGRISVRGDEKHIEASTGTKPTQFRYKLSFRGDMAVRIDEVSSATVFVHAGVLTDDNDKNNEIFDYLRRLWLKLEPDSFNDSVALNAEAEKQNQKVLNELNNTTDDFISDLNDEDMFDEAEPIEDSSNNTAGDFLDSLDDIDLFAEE